MTTPLEIRAARRQDMPAVAALSRELAAHVGDPDPGAGARELESYGFCDDRWFECLVAATEGHIVGFALFCRRFEAHTRERRIWLADLCVACEARGRGVGHALIGAVQERARSLGCTAVDFELARENSSAREFYEGLRAERCDVIEAWRLPLPARTA